MVSSLIRFKGIWSALTKLQKIKVLRYLIFVNLIVLIVLSIIVIKIDKMRIQESSYIKDRTTLTPSTIEAQIELKKKQQIDAKVYLAGMREINTKDKFVNAWLYIILRYPQGLGIEPKIDIANGEVRDKRITKKEIINGIVQEAIMLEVEADPLYLVQLYPLDRQLVMFSIAPDDDNPQYYFKVTNFYNMSETNLYSDYKLIKQGFYNQVVSYTKVEEKRHEYDMRGRIFLVFNHKHFYTYIKNIQYILLSVLIAIFALLLNSPKNGPSHGRIAVIGSSIFSLAANAFQINSSVKSVNAVTLFDLITTFNCLIILLCFWVTLRTLRFIDEDGYATSKAFDQLMYLSLMIITVVFFSLIYIIA